MTIHKIELYWQGASYNCLTSDYFQVGTGGVTEIDENDYCFRIQYETVRYGTPVKFIKTINKKRYHQYDVYRK